MHPFRDFDFYSFLPARLAWQSPETGGETVESETQASEDQEFSENEADKAIEEANRSIAKAERQAKRAERQAKREQKAEGWEDRIQNAKEFKREAVRDMIRAQGDRPYRVLLHLEDVDSSQWGQGEMVGPDVDGDGVADGGRIWMPATVENRIKEVERKWADQDKAEDRDDYGVSSVNAFAREITTKNDRKLRREERKRDRGTEKGKARRKDEVQSWGKEAGWEFVKYKKEAPVVEGEPEEISPVEQEGPEPKLASQPEPVVEPTPKPVVEPVSEPIEEPNLAEQAPATPEPELGYFEGMESILTFNESGALRGYVTAHPEMGELNRDEQIKLASYAKGELALVTGEENPTLTSEALNSMDLVKVLENYRLDENKKRLSSEYGVDQLTNDEVEMLMNYPDRAYLLRELVAYKEARKKPDVREGTAEEIAQAKAMLGSEYRVYDLNDAEALLLIDIVNTPLSRSNAREVLLNYREFKTKQRIRGQKDKREK